MKKLIREPLVHFLLLGAALFGVYSMLNKNTAASREDIVVTTGQVENFAATFARVWQRPPTAEELKAQIDQYVKEEILSREAMKLGLDQNDTIIRRRLQQKMEFIADDLVAATEPTDAELADYLAKHQDAFRQDQRLTFRQIYLNPEKRGDDLEPYAARLLAELKTKGGKADAAAPGDPTLLPPAMTDEPQSGVERSFGREFAGQLALLPVGEWSGPVQSGFGMHLVLIENRTEGRVPPLADVIGPVRREWENERRIKANRKFLDGLLEQYEVKIQWPKPEEAAKVVKAE